jgi:hypothetical protein
MTPGLMTKMFGSQMEEPMVDERFGHFQNIQIPVQKTPGPANWWLVQPGDAEYLTPQTQDEHNKLLNTYYSSRLSNPQWKEMGRAEEKNSPHYSDKDNRLRKNLGARSSFVTDIVYDPETERAMIQLGGGKYYTYAATPEQLKSFMRAGSLGKEINRIKRGQGTSLEKTSARQSPNKSGFNIRSLFGV